MRWFFSRDGGEKFLKYYFVWGWVPPHFYWRFTNEVILQQRWGVPFCWNLAFLSLWALRWFMFEAAQALLILHFAREVTSLGLTLFTHEAKLWNWQCKYCFLLKLGVFIPLGSFFFKRYSIDLLIMRHFLSWSENSFCAGKLNYITIYVIPKSSRWKNFSWQCD